MHDLSLCVFCFNSQNALLRCNTNMPPPWSLRVLRSFNLQLAGLYQYFHLIFGTAAYQPQQPTEDTVRIAQSLLRLLEEREESGQRGSAQCFSIVSQLIKQCSDLDSLLQVTNSHGYNVLQVAVLNNDRLFLKVLVSEGCDLNRGKCSLPLHLACRLGNLDLVKFLLQEGARHNIEIGMCYPKSHVPVRHVPSRFHFLETDIYTCDSDHLLPLMYAIHEDHVDVVKCLMEAGDAKCTWPYRRQPLHFACKHGACQSMKYLTVRCADEINDPDEEGCTPLLHGVKWGRSFVQYLVEAGAHVHAANSKGHTALHLLYSHIQDPMELYPTTRFLLGSGLEADINHVDSEGNSPLHILVSQLNCIVDSFPHGSGPPPSQDQFDQHVLDTLELLLMHNCDPNLVNTSGVTAIHKLLLTFDFVISNDPTGITFETLPVREKYKTDFDVLYRAMQVLLKHGASPNMTTGAGRTPMIMLLHTMLNVDPQKLAQFTKGFLRCLSLLCDWGTDPSAALPTHITTVISLCKFGHKCLSLRDEEIKQIMAVFLHDVVTLLLANGLNPNHQSWQRKREVEGDSGNILVELVKLAQFIRHPGDLRFIQSWLLTALQWGADPDLEPYPSDSIICTSQSNIYLKPKATQPVNQYLFQIQDLRDVYEGGHAEKVLELFHATMDHVMLYQCLNNARHISRFDPSSTRTPSSSFIFMINNRLTKPRSLKEIARVAIYKALDRKLVCRVEHLPLPTAMKDYILNVEE